jgi:hypothetical protein
MRQLPWIIVVLLSFALPIAHAQEATHLNYGQVASGEVTADQPLHTYTFDGAEGDKIYVYMHTPNQDLTPNVRLTAVGGVVVAEADSNNSLGALLGPFTLEGTTTYTIEASHPDWAADTTGAFTLVVDRVNPAKLEPGAPVSGSLANANSLAFFEYTGAANDVVRYRTIGADLGIGVFLPDGTPAFYDGIYDDPSSLFNILPQDGDYLLYVHTASDAGVDYTLTVSQLEVQPLAEGAPVTGTNDELNPVIVSFESDAGKLLALNATVDGADSRTLAIFPASDPCCDLIRDYGSGPNGNPRIDPFIVPASGAYYVVLWYDLYSEENAALDYEVTLGASTLISLSSGAEINDTITPESGVKTYSYDASLGETMNLTLTRTGGQGWPSIRVTGPEGQVLYFESSSISSVTFEIVFPAAGLYRFEIGNTYYEPTAVEYSLRVE